MPELRDADALLAFVENRRGSVNEPPTLPKRSRPYDLQAKLGIFFLRAIRENLTFTKITFTINILLFLDVAISREVGRDMSSFGNSNGKNREQRSDQASTRPKTLLGEFFYDLNPIGHAEWKEAPILVKILVIIRSPFMFILQLLIPVVNETAEKQGWSKLLNCLQLFLTLNVSLLVFGCKY